MRRNGRFIFAFGCVLIASGLVSLFLLQMYTKKAEEKNIEIVRIIEDILGDHREGTKDLEREAEMPALQIQGNDFIALLEIPAHGLKLPVYKTWHKGKVLSYPCRFYGSAYDGTLIVGGYDRPGQFVFFDRIRDGAVVTVTDMTGNVFSYTVERVQRSDFAQAEILMDEKSDLTLFVRDAQSLEYIFLRCVEK